MKLPVSKTHPSKLFYPEDGGRIYLRSVDSTVYIHIVSRPKARVNVRSDLP